MPLNNPASDCEKVTTPSSNGNVVIALKPPYHDGFTRVVLSPIESMGRREALVPRLRVYLTRFQGVPSPRSKLRDYFVSQKPVDENENRKSTAYSMNWAQRLLPVAFTATWHPS